MFSPSDPETTDQLYDKIKSKMNTAKALGAFLTGLLTFSAAQALGATFAQPIYEALAGLGFASLLLGVGLCFLALFRYDELLMPKRFWTGEPSRSERPSRRGFVSRPPASDTWALYQNIIHVWDCLFVPATTVAGVGVTLLAVAFLQPDGPTRWVATIATILLVVAALVGAGRRSRLRLGVND